jgi:hypothetical protein
MQPARLRMVPVPGNANASTLESARRSATGRVGLFEMGAPARPPKPANTAALVGRCSIIGGLDLTGTMEVGHLAADPVALELAMAAVAHDPHDILSIIKQVDAFVTSVLPPVPEDVAGAELRMNAYLGTPGKLPPHRHGAGGAAALPEGMGSKTVRHIKMLGRHIAQIAYSVAERDDRVLVLEVAGERLVVPLPPGLSAHIMGFVGSGRIQLPSEDGGGFILHGQWAPGLPDPGPSLTFMRQVCYQSLFVLLCVCVWGVFIVWVCLFFFISACLVNICPTNPFIPSGVRRRG